MVRRGLLAINSPEFTKEFPMLRKAIIPLVLGSLALAGCNTVRGVGDDLKSAADAVDDAT